VISDTQIGTNLKTNTKITIDVNNANIHNNHNNYLFSLCLRSSWTFPENVVDDMNYVRAQHEHFLGNQQFEDDLNKAKLVQSQANNTRQRMLLTRHLDYSSIAQACSGW
jgi:hypothetical protein